MSLQATDTDRAGEDRARELLRGCGLRVTQPRTAVLLELEQRPHADVDNIAAAVRDRLGAVSTQAVYDVLAALTRAGLVRRVEPAGHPARYERQHGDNHHHIVCRGCGAIDDIACTSGQAPCLTPHSNLGFVIDEAEVTFWGWCPSCSSMAGEPRPESTKEK